MNTTILLNSGNYFDFADVDHSVLSIEDIAHGLSLSCRFSGQCNKFYSIAEHSYWVSIMVPEEYALVGLLHDASESVLQDMVKPLKNMMPEYRAMEENVERKIARDYDLPFPYPPEIKEADVRMLITEQRVLFKSGSFDQKIWDKVSPYTQEEVDISCWSWHEAEQVFLTRYRDLTGKKCNGY